MHTEQVADGLSTVRRSVLPGGLRVITEALPVRPLGRVRDLGRGRVA